MLEAFEVSELHLPMFRTENPPRIGDLLRRRNHVAKATISETPTKAPMTDPTITPVFLSLDDVKLDTGLGVADGDAVEVLVRQDVFEPSEI